MNAATSQAAIKKPFKVLGRKLKPFSLWHQTLLENMDSSFAIGSAEKTSYEDLIFTAYFCSLDYEKGLARLSSGFLPMRFKLWGIRCGHFDVVESINTLCEYITHYSGFPNYWTEQTGGGKSGVSYAQFLKVKMMQEFGMSEVEALNTPYNSAVINYLTVLDSKGVIRFMSAEDEDLIAKAKSMDARLQAMAAKVGNN